MSDQPQYPTYPDYQQPQQQQPQYPPVQPPKKGGMGKWIALGGCGCFFFLAVIAAIVYFVFQLTAAPMKAVNEQLVAIRTDDVAKAYELCSSGFRKETSLQDFQQFLRGYPFFSSAKEFSSFNRKTEGGVTTLDGNVETSDGTKHPVEYRVIKENGVHLVHAIQVKEAAKEVPVPERQEPSGGDDTEDEESSGDDSSGGTGTPPEIFDVSVNKSQSGQMITITVLFQVQGFQNQKRGGSYEMHLVQDLETIGPDGNRMSDLSAQGIKTLNETGATEYTSANFSNTLTIPETYPHGTYMLKLTVHDQFGGGATDHTVSFEFP